MIESFSVKNFRCFEHINFIGLKRINVVAGGNATGKSALLEAIYLGANATATALHSINTARSLTQGSPLVLAGQFPIPIAFQPQTPAASFGHLFRSWRGVDGLESSKRIEIEYKNTQEITYKLGIALQGSSDNTPVPVGRSPGGLSAFIPLIFNRQKFGPSRKVTETSNIPVTINQMGQLAQPPAAQFGPTTFIFGSGMDYAEIDNVTWFSQLKEKDEAERVIQFIREEFPFVANIEVLAPTGTNGLYAKLKDGTTRRVSTVSSGIYKIISILLGCASTRNGIIIIDEIENGIFYEKYGALWRILYRFATETGNQIFTSSHSLECLEDLAPVMEGNENDFVLLRTERNDATCTVTQISGTSMKAALKRGGEIRGATLGKDGADH